jgi:hypothetical protein
MADHSFSDESKVWALLRQLPGSPLTQSEIAGAMNKALITGRWISPDSSIEVKYNEVRDRWTVRLAQETGT